MALSTTPVDTNRGTSSLSLPPVLSNEIIAGAIEQSAIMRMTPRVYLPGAGAAINCILGEAEAAWTAESTEKYVGKPTLVTKTMKPYKLALIELFSEEFRRDLPALYDELRRRLPGAIAKKFDSTVFYGTTPGTGFDVLAASPQTYDQATGWETLIAAKQSVATAGGDVTAWALSPAGELTLLSDQGSGSGLPIFAQSVTDGLYGRLIGAPVYMSKAADDTANTGAWAVAGDWNMARWGIVDDIRIKISEEATVNDGSNQINLWQRNMFAVMVEAELGFICADDDYFTLIGGTDPNA